MPERCPRCGSTHDSLDGVAVHAWKMGDDAHEDITSKDEGMRVAVEEEYSPDDQPADDPPENGDSKSPDSDDLDDSNNDSGLGLSGPPSAPDDDPQNDDSTDTVEAPCGHEFETADLEDGKKYRCTDCDVSFVFHA